MSRSYCSQRDKDDSKFNGYDVSNRRYDDRNSESVAATENKVGRSVYILNEMFKWHY